MVHCIVPTSCKRRVHARAWRVHVGKAVPSATGGVVTVEELQHEQKARESPAARASANPSLCVQGSESDEVARLRRSLVSITSSEHLGKLRNDDLEELQRALSRAAFATQEFIFKERLPSGWNVE